MPAERLPSQPQDTYPLYAAACWDIVRSKEWQMPRQLLRAWVSARN